ncbi:MAG: zinc ribbon domain-containing protein [Clostridia bacterium]|nr:zinc ribbon domain-containing protein [Clostridia bacterium]
MKSCKKCGHALPDEAVFCTNCGAVYEAEATDTVLLDGLVPDDTEYFGEKTTVLSDGENEDADTAILNEDTTVLSELVLNERYEEIEDSPEEEGLTVKESEHADNNRNDEINTYEMK